MSRTVRMRPFADIEAEYKKRSTTQLLPEDYDKEVKVIRKNGDGTLVVKLFASGSSTVHDWEWEDDVNLKSIYEN